jgi:ribonuclease HI
MPKTKKIYAVAKGKKTGIYKTWDECQAQVKGFPNNRFKSFPNEQQALEFIRKYGDTTDAAQIITVKTERTSKRSAVSNRKEMQLSKDHTRTCPIAEEIHSSRKRRRLNSDNQKVSFSFMINFDGGSRGNPGISGAGAQIIILKTILDSSTPTAKASPKRSKTQIRHFLGLNYTNNQAEYQGMICGLEKVKEILQGFSYPPPVTLTVQGDSKLIINQLKGIYECKSTNLISYYRKAKKVLQEIKSLSLQLKASFEHVYRNNNTIADGKTVSRADLFYLFVCTFQ